MFFYGFDLKLQPNFEYEKDTYDLYEKYLNVSTGIFLGGEFEITKWFTLRVCTRTIIIDYTSYLLFERYNSYPYFYTPYYSSYSLGTSNITIGFMFKPSKAYMIEINTSLLNINFYSNSSKYYDENFEYINNSKTLSFRIEAGIYFDIDYKNKYKKENNKSIENTYDTSNN